MQFVLETVHAFWRLTEEMAPYLWLGFLSAVALRIFISDAWVRRHLGQRGWRQTVKAAVLGVPLPLCSCGVIPVAASLRRQGGSAGAVTSFTASTPQTGVDSIFATAALLNWPFAAVRVVVSFVSGVLAGTLVDRFASGKDTTSAEDSAAPASAGACCKSAPEAQPSPVAARSAAAVGAPLPSSCCGSEKTDATVAVAESSSCCGGETAGDEIAEEVCGCASDAGQAPASASSCCAGSKETKASPNAETACCSSEGAAEERPSLGSRVREALRFGLLVLPADIGKALLFGLVLAALLTVLLPSDLAEGTWTTGLLAYLATTIVAVPLYVCATGSIPMAYALIHAGFSPGAALVFLIAGPATNTATVSALWQMIGGRAVFIYLATLIGVAWLSGFVFDQMGSVLEIGHLHGHEESAAWWKTFSAVTLLALFALAYLKPQRWFAR